MARHRHGAHLGACPWCALAADGRDPFNPPGQAPPAARTRGGHAVTAALALALLLVLAVLAALVLGLVSL